MSKRDPQQSKLYYAERQLWDIFDTCAQTHNPEVEVEHQLLTLPPEGKFADIARLQKYYDDVCAMMGAPSVSVRASRNDHGNAFTRCLAQEIVIPDGRDRWAMRELVVLHELAHHITFNQSPLCESHGGEFVANYIELLTRVMGEPAGWCARVIYSKNGVKEGATK